MNSAIIGAGGTSTLTGTNLAPSESPNNLIGADQSRFLQKSHWGGRFESVSPIHARMAQTAPQELAFRPKRGV